MDLKELLLKDLCARLPYGVMCFAPDYEYGDIGKLWCIEPFEDLDPPITVQYPRGNTITKFCSEVKPYLRPLSSMTEEEKKEFEELGWRVDELEDNKPWICNSYRVIEGIDWLNKKMFAYRTIDGKDMFELGLALKASEGMYV